MSDRAGETPNKFQYWVPDSALPMSPGAIHATGAFDENLSEPERHRRKLIAAYLTQFGLVKP